MEIVSWLVSQLFDDGKRVKCDLVVVVFLSFYIISKLYSSMLEIDSRGKNWGCRVVHSFSNLEYTVFETNSNTHVGYMWCLCNGFKAPLVM